jgi:hypothetical protein
LLLFPRRTNFDEEAQNYTHFRRQVSEQIRLILKVIFAGVSTLKCMSVSQGVSRNRVHPGKRVRTGVILMAPRVGICDKFTEESVVRISPSKCF